LTHTKKNNNNNNIVIGVRGKPNTKIIVVSWDRDHAPSSPLASPGLLTSRVVRVVPRWLRVFVCYIRLKEISEHIDEMRSPAWREITTNNNIISVLMNIMLLSSLSWLVSSYRRLKTEKGLLGPSAGLPV